MLLEKHLTASKGLVVNLCFCRVAIEVTKNKWQKVKIEIGKESKKNWIHQTLLSIAGRV
jgi:hypothetical protein